MQVILQETIEKGKVGDVIEVRNGYARNYLFPKGLAVPLNEENKKILEAKRAELDALAANELQSAQDLAKSMSGLALSLSVEAHDSGELYGSVSTNQLQDLIKDQGFTLEKKCLHVVQGSIKNIGDYQIIVQLHPEVKFELPLTVSALTGEDSREA